jgi:hypothetical protein
MFNGFSGLKARYKTGLKPWGSRSGNTIPAVIPRLPFHVPQNENGDSRP